MSNIVSIINGQSLASTLIIAEGVGYDHSTVIRLVRENKEDLEEFGLLGFEIRPRQKGKHGGGDIEYALLNEDQATLLMTYMRNNDVIKAFKKQLVKAFRDLRNSNSRSMPGSFAEALQLAANIEREKEQALIERDKAIKTKAEIGSNREATAMARASAETRRANKLANQLGEGREWKAVKSIKWLSDVFEISRAMYQQVGKKLKAISDELNLEVKEIEDSAYGAIKAYHINAIEELHNRLEVDGELLCRYKRLTEAA